MATAATTTATHATASPRRGAGIGCAASTRGADTHTLASLLASLEKKVSSGTCADHDVEGVRAELCRWRPAADEWEEHATWDDSTPAKYTRNLLFQNAHMDVILMCWPPGCRSSIHDHDSSSCWAFCVEGEITEVQYHTPELGAELRRRRVSVLAPGACAYVDNRIGLHQVCNETAARAVTVHVYAPGLTKCKVFTEAGGVATVALSRGPEQRRDTRSKAGRA